MPNLLKGCGNVSWKLGEFLEQHRPASGMAAGEDHQRERSEIIGVPYLRETRCKVETFRMRVWVATP